MTGIVAIMMGTHFTEVLIWALFYMLRGVVPDLRSAILFSIHSYTTLGTCTITLIEPLAGHRGI